MDGQTPSQPFRTAPRGIVAMIEDASSDRYQALDYFDDQGVNGLKVLSAQGNFDYTASAATSAYNNHLLGIQLYNFTNPIANPFGGESQISRHRFDANHNDIIVWNPTQGNTGGPRNEQQFSVVVNGALEDGVLGPDIAFNVGQKLSLSSPTPIFEHQHYDANAAKLSPIMLSGLSVEILSQDNTTGAITIRVRYDDVTIATDTRWTGDLVMTDAMGPTGPNVRTSGGLTSGGGAKPLPGTGAAPNVDISVNGGVTLTLNKSGTPNRHLPTAAGDFINSTRLVCPAGTLLMLNTTANDIGSAIVVEGDKTTFQLAGEMQLSRSCQVLVKTGALLELMAGSNTQLSSPGFTSSLHVEAGGTLLIHSGATVQGLGAIVVNNGGYVCVASGATLSCMKDIAAGAIIGTNPSLGLSGQNCQTTFLVAPTPTSTQRSLYTATPNPANDRVNLALLLHQAGEVAISLQDLSGVSRLRLAPRSLEAGTHTLEVPLQSVPTGVYMLVVESPEGRQVTRLQVNH